MLPCRNKVLRVSRFIASVILHLGGRLRRVVKFMPIRIALAKESRYP